MKIVNRGAITVEPRQTFMEWAQQLQPDQPLPPWAFEPGLHLLPLYKSRKGTIELMQQGYEEIGCSELETWSPDPETWPGPRTLVLFQEWFGFRCHDPGSDQGQVPRLEVMAITARTNPPVTATVRCSDPVPRSGPQLIPRWAAIRCSSSSMRSSRASS